MPELSLRLRLISVLLRVAAWLWRRLLVRTTFIGITGSVGKTAAKDALAACLSSLGRVTATAGNRNDGFFGVPKTILRTRPWHRFAVVEVATAGPGQLEVGARILRPDIALVLTVARNHTKSFESLEEIAEEKRQLLVSLRRGGVAVLNGDDPWVNAMIPPSGTRTVRFGRAAVCEYRSGGASSVWPERLNLTVSAGFEDIRMQTRMVGTHWVCSVLGAVAVAHQCGVSLERAAQALSQVEPYLGRMQPVELEGATFLRDDFKLSPANFPAALQVLREAKAARRVLVFSDLSDSGVRQQVRMRTVGEQAAASADLAIFVGRLAELARKCAVKAGMGTDSALAFVSLEAAAEYLKTGRRPGDLILITGQTTDHLSRLWHAQTGPVSCWISKCRIPRVCDECPKLRAGAAPE